VYRKEQPKGEGTREEYALAGTESGLKAMGDTVGGRHLSLLLLPYEFVPFDEALQRLHGLVEQLEIPEE